MSAYMCIYIYMKHLVNPTNSQCPNLFSKPAANRAGSASGESAEVEPLTFLSSGLRTLV